MHCSSVPSLSFNNSRRVEGVEGNGQRQMSYCFLLVFLFNHICLFVPNGIKQTIPNLTREPTDVVMAMRLFAQQRTSPAVRQSFTAIDKIQTLLVSCLLLTRNMGLCLSCDLKTISFSIPWLQCMHSAPMNLNTF